MTALALLAALILNALGLLAASACTGGDDVLPDGAGVIMFGAASMLSLLAAICWAFVGYQLAG